MAVSAWQQATNLFNQIKSQGIQLPSQFTSQAPWTALKSKLDSVFPPVIEQTQKQIGTTWNSLRQKVDQILPPINNAAQSAISNQLLFQVPGVGFTPQIPGPTVGQGANFLKSVTLEPPARVGGALTLTAQGRTSYTPTTGFEKSLYGSQPIKSFPQQQKEASQFLQNVGVNTNASNALAAGGILGMAALDVLPITSGKGKVAKRIAEETAQTLRKTGKNLFSNVKTIDNPLLLGKDWRIRKNIEEGKKFVSEMMEEKRILKDPQNLTDSFDDLVNKTPVDVKKKVNIIDYLRTPNRVLEKIGLGEEAKLLRTKYDDYLADLPKEIDKITAWSKRVPSSSNQRIFQWLDGDKIKLNNEELKVASEVKDYLGQWANKLKLPQDKRVSSYITHLFEKGKITKEFDPDLAKIIQGKVVGSVYDPFLQRRVGAPEYLQDTWKALDVYTKRATRKFHMDQALEKVAEKAESLPLESFNYVKGRIARINMQPTDIDNLIDNAIKSSPIGYRLGQRPVTSVTQKARQMVFRGLLGLNPGTAFRNLQQSTNTYAVIGEKNFGVGLMKTVQNLPRLILGKDTELEAAGVLGKDIVQDRTISAVGKFWQKADDTLFYMFNLAEKVNRGIAYFGAKSKGLSQGMSEIKAIEYAKDIVGKTQFFYDVIDTPAALQSDLAKTLFQFAKYSLAETEFLAEMVKNKNVAGSLRWIASNLLFVGTAGKLLGLEPQDMFPQFRFGVPPTLQLPFETGKAALNVPDQYGNISDEQNPLMRVFQSKDVLKGALNYVPAGGQLRKSFEAGQAMQEGGSFTPSGKLRFEVSPSVKTALLGIWSTKEAQDYLNKRQGVGLSQEEQQAREFKKGETETSNNEQRLAGMMYLQLKNLKTKTERKQYLDSLEQQGLLSEDVRKKVRSLTESKKKESFSNFSKAVRMLNANEPKARFIVRYFKDKSEGERKILLQDLEDNGLLTDDLREKIRKQAKSGRD